MRFRLKLAVGVAVLGAAGVGTAAIAQDRIDRLEAFLHGYEEVPAVSIRRARLVRGVDISRDEIADRLDVDLRRAPWQRHRRPKRTSTSLRRASTAASSCGSARPARRPRPPARRRARSRRRVSASR